MGTASRVYLHNPAPAPSLDILLYFGVCLSFALFFAAASRGRFLIWGGRAPQGVLHPPAPASGADVLKCCRWRSSMVGVYLYVLSYFFRFFATRSFQCAVVSALLCAVIPPFDGARGNLRGNTRSDPRSSGGGFRCWRCRRGFGGFRCRLIFAFCHYTKTGAPCPQSRLGRLRREGARRALRKIPRLRGCPVCRVGE